MAACCKGLCDACGYQCCGVQGLGSDLCECHCHAPDCTKVVKFFTKCCEPAPHSYDLSLIFWDASGNLRQGRSDRRRDDEVLRLMEDDSIEEKEDKIWMIVPSRWIRFWLIFAQKKIGGESPPGPVNVCDLLQADDTMTITDYGVDGLRPTKTIRPPSRVQVEDDKGAKVWQEEPGHFRRVGWKTFKSMVSLYDLKTHENGNCYAIAVMGNTEESPWTDTKRWRIFEVHTANLFIDKSILPVPIADKTAEELKKEDQKRRKSFLASGGTV